VTFGASRILFALGLVLSVPIAGFSQAVDAKKDEPPSANPARPTITNPATLTPVGYLQFEQGYLGSLDSPETTSQHGVNQTLKLTVLPRLMLDIGSQPYAVSNPGSSQDAGDLLVGAQAIMYSPPDPTDDAAQADEHRHDIHRHSYVRSAIPTVSGAYLQRVHAGTAPDIDLGSQLRTAVLLFSGHAPGIDVHYDVNIIASEQEGDSSLYADATVRRAQFGQTFSIDRPIFNPNLQLSLEVYRFSQPLVHETSGGAPVARASLVGGLFALSYQLKPNLVFDGGFEHGFTSTSTRWQTFAGFTYLLPKRLWPKRK
jgi:hypothetical protein